MTTTAQHTKWEMRRYTNMWDGLYRIEVGPVSSEQNAFTVSGNPISPEEEKNVQRAIECRNACAGLSDPAAALQAAREALHRLIISIDAGNIVRPDFAIFDQARAALRQLNGEAQP